MGPGWTLDGPPARLQLARTLPVPRTPPALKDIHPGCSGWARAQRPKRRSQGVKDDRCQLKGPAFPLGLPEATRYGCRDVSLKVSTVSEGGWDSGFHSAA